MCGKKRCSPEPAVMSCETVKRIPYFDSCLVIITWMSNIKLNTICILYAFDFLS